MSFTGIVRKSFLIAGMLTGFVVGGVSAEEIHWKPGWIAQSYGIKIGSDAPTPTDLLLNTWLDSGKGLFTTDYLFAFDSQRTFIFNAGILRSGSIRIREPGTYRFHLYLDRYLGSGTPECRGRLSIDGATIIDSAAAMSKRESGSITANPRARAEARNFHESQHAKSAVIRVDEPGFYRLDFWSVCRDLNDKQATYNLSNELGNRVEKRGIFSTRMQRIQSFYGGDGQITAAQEHRMKTNPIKQIIAENHSTMFDLVLENIETGNKGRIDGSTIFHNRDFSPEQKLEYDVLPPSGQGSVESGNWVFNGVREDLKSSYTQPSGYSPMFESAARQMPFVSAHIEGRKQIRIKKSGTYDLAIGYEPRMSGSDFLTHNGRRSRGEREMFRPESEPLSLFLEKRLENGKYKRIKIYEGALVGSNYVGEIRFQRINLQAGTYDLVMSQDAENIAWDRYANPIEDYNDSQMSIRIKPAGAEGFRILD